MPYDNIAQHAHALGAKPSKSHAAEMLRDLYARADSNADREALARLFTYFRPPAPRKIKTAWEWVALAVATKDVREYLCYIHVTDRYITACDGHRMHRTPNSTGLPAGFYNREGDLIHGPEYARYPDTERLLLSARSGVIHRAALEKVTEEAGDAVDTKVTRHHVTVGALTADLNLAYWGDLVGRLPLQDCLVQAMPNGFASLVQIDATGPDGTTLQGVLMGLRP